MTEPATGNSGKRPADQLALLVVQRDGDSKSFYVHVPDVPPGSMGRAEYAAIAGAYSDA